MANRILIVDDDPDVLNLLQEVLTSAGYIITTASTGTEALTKTQRPTPDLIILDLILPEMNGFTVCQQLRGQRATTSVPIMMITALPGEFPRLAGVEAGADAHVRKPFEVQELVSRVDALLHTRREFPYSSWRRNNRAAGRALSHAL